MSYRIQITIQPIKNNSFKVSLATSRFSEIVSPRAIKYLTKADIALLQNVSSRARARIQNVSLQVPAAELEEIGRLLFGKLFQESILQEFNATLKEARETRSKINFALQIPETLANIWWELLYSTEARARGFLSLNHDIHFSRFTGSSFWPLPPDPVERLNILVVVSQPADQKSLDANKEVDILRTVLSERSRINFQVQINPTILEFKGQVSSFKPNIIHFVGHAVFQPDEENGSGLIFPDDEEQKSLVLSSIDFAQILKQNSRECSLVILNACDTATVGYSYDNSIAGELVQAGIPAVIGMQCKIPNNIALIFSECFYSYLLDEFCQPIDLALNNARSFIHSQRLNMKLLDKYWCAPVLYSRSREGLLFTLREYSAEVQQFERMYNLILSLGYLSDRAAQIAFSWLKEQGIRAIPILSMLLLNGNTLLRQRAVTALTQQEDHIAREILRLHLEDESNSSIREKIVEFLQENNSSTEGLPPKRKSETKALRKAQNTHVESKTKIRQNKPKARELELLRQIERNRTQFIQSVNNAISTSEVRLEEFKGEYTQLEGQINTYLKASKGVLIGIRRLNRWASLQYVKRANIVVRSRRVSREVQKINKYMNKWNQHVALIQQIWILEAKHKILEQQLDGDIPKINQSKQNLWKFDKNQSSSFKQAFFWFLNRRYADLSQIRHKIKRYQLRRKTMKLVTTLQITSIRISNALDMIHNTTIHTVDNVQHIIEVEGRDNKSK